jgi:hypothetical protein
MSLRKTLAKLFVFAVLQFGALVGVPMRPEEIEKLMNVMNRTKIVHVVKKDDPPC